MHHCLAAGNEDAGRNDSVTAAPQMPGHPPVMVRVALPHVNVGCKYAMQDAVPNAFQTARVHEKHSRDFDDARARERTDGRTADNGLTS